MTCKKLFLPLLLTGFIFINVGCSDSSSSGGNADINPTLPATAIQITSANADSTAAIAASTTEITTGFTGVQSNLPSTQQIIDIIVDRSFNKNRRSYSIATGLTDSYICSISGSINEEWTDSPTSESGSVSFNACDDGFGFIMDGSFHYSASWNSDGDFTGISNGSVTINFGSDPFTMAFNISVSGNDVSGDYNIDLLYSASSPAFGGFLVETTQALSGTDPFGPSSGQLLVTGGNNSRLRITITSTTTATVELDDGSGTFVMHNNNFSLL